MAAQGRDDAIPAAAALLRCLEDRTRAWIGDGSPTLPGGLAPSRSFMQTAVELHRRNFFQWDREARVREPTLAPAAVTTLKREIDASNGQRAALTEQLDELAVAVLRDPASHDLGQLYINSDTIGQLVDKFSVLTLRIAFTSEAPEDGTLRGRNSHRQTSALHRQREYLSACYDRFVAHLARGEAKMPVWRHFKSYDSAPGGSRREAGGP